MQTMSESVWQFNSLFNLYRFEANHGVCSIYKVGICIRKRNGKSETIRRSRWNNWEELRTVIAINRKNYMNF